MQNQGAIFSQKAEADVAKFPFGSSQPFHSQEPCLAEVTGRNQEGLLLRLETGVDALAPLPEWSELTVETGKQVVVKIHSISAQMQINCRLLQVFD